MNGDIVRLCVPARPDYILAVRLAVSAVAERVGFDIEDIEDIKVASAEACTLLLAASPASIELHLTVCDGLCLDFKADGKAAKGSMPPQEEDSLSQYLLDALVDSCDFDSDGSVINAVKLQKKLMP